MQPTNSRSADALVTAQKVADQFAAIDDVEAVALGGSETAQVADQHSDIDLYVYASSIVPEQLRADIAGPALRPEIGNSFWEPADEWVDPTTSTRVDVMFRTTSWIEDQLNRVLRRHEASVGYSTCFWYNVRNSRPLFDRAGWFRKIQQDANQPYPEELKRAIVAKNHPILRANMSSYLHQIELALKRHDTVSVNHRVGALLASYFDIVFAVNEQPHPGEKRLLYFAQLLCRHLPPGMAEQVEAVLSALPDGDMVRHANTLLDGLDALPCSRGLGSELTIGFSNASQ